MRATVMVSALGRFLFAALLIGMAEHAGATAEFRGPEQAEKAIKAVLGAQQSAWNRGDIPAFLEGYWNSPDLTFSGPNGIVRGYAGVLERYQKAYPDKASMGQLEFSGLEIRKLGQDSALVLGRWHLNRKMGDAGGVFTLVFERFPAGWRIIHDHTSTEKLGP
jgi:L-asparaginase / beta-aspartyl-peptidase